MKKTIIAAFLALAVIAPLTRTSVADSVDNVLDFTVIDYLNAAGQIVGQKWFGPCGSGQWGQITNRRRFHFEPCDPSPFPQ